MSDLMKAWAGGALVCLGLVGSGCAAQESPGSSGAVDGGGGVGGRDGGVGGREGGVGGRDGGAAGSNVVCLDASRSLAPRCGGACTNPCGCRTCNVGDRDGNLVCSRPGCFEPVLDGGGECSPPAAFDCTDGYVDADGGVCGDTVSAPVCVNGDFQCPIGSIPTTRCTAHKCPSALPSGSCRGNESFSCVGWVYPFVSVSCLCISGTWSCQL